MALEVKFGTIFWICLQYKLTEWLNLVLHVNTDGSFFVFIFEFNGSDLRNMRTADVIQLTPLTCTLSQLILQQNTVIKSAK